MVVPLLNRRQHNVATGDSADITVNLVDVLKRVHRLVMRNQLFQSPVAQYVRQFLFGRNVQISLVGLNVNLVDDELAVKQQHLVGVQLSVIHPIELVSD